MSLFSELKRRNVFRVAMAYLVVGWLLTEVSTTLLPTFGAPDWVPRVVIFVFALGFFPAVIFAWVYELTPEGIRKEKDVDRSASITTDTGRKLNIITLVAVVFAVAFTAFARFGGDVHVVEPAGENLSAAEDASVAVLPFVNMSGSVDNEYFSDGLTETLLHMLAQIPDLKVAARTSSFAFKGENRNISDIAGELNVAHVLEGSVQRAGERVRVTVQLIRAADGYHVWSENFDRTLTDIFAVQDEIANRVGGELSASLLGVSGESGIAGVATANVDAYDLYLQALAARADGSHRGLVAAEDHLQNALRLDPAFHDAKIALAGVYLDQGDTNRIPLEESLRKANALADQVMAERDGDPGAKAILAYVRGQQSAQEADFDDVRKQVALLRDIIAQAPSDSMPRILLINLLDELAEDEDAAEAAEQALAIDPLNAELMSKFGSRLIRLDRDDDARALLDRALAIDPNQPNAYAALADISLRQGDGVGAIANYLKGADVDSLDHELPARVAEILYRLGLPDEAAEYYARVQATAPTSPVAYLLAMERALTLGDDQALRAAATRVLEEDIPNRQGVRVLAITWLLDLGIRDGNIEDVLDTVGRNEPGVVEFGTDGLAGQSIRAQFAALGAWFELLPREEVIRRADYLHDWGLAQGFDMEGAVGWTMRHAAIRGETDRALKIALEQYFAKPSLVRGWWRESVSQPYFDELRAHPAVQEAIARWERQEAEIREQLRRFLADRQG